MALVSVSAKCFNNIESALTAVRTGDIQRSEDMLKLVKEDGLLLQRTASILRYRLREAEDKHKHQVEAVTRQINELYKVQRQHEKKKQELEANISSLTYQKECHSQSKREASRKYQEAEREKREAEEKDEEFSNFFWVPFYGQYLLVRELIERNDKKAKAAQREMESHERDIERAERDIEWANSEIYQAEKNIQEISTKVEKLKSQRDTCHNELGDVKSLVAFIMQAITFWHEVVDITKAATMNTEHVQRLVALANKKNSVRILKSRGTKTKINSFKESWMEVAEMITSDENNLVLYGKALEIDISAEQFFKIIACPFVCFAFSYHVVCPLAIVVGGLYLLLSFFSIFHK